MTKIIFAIPVVALLGLGACSGSTPLTLSQADSNAIVNAADQAINTTNQQFTLAIAEANAMTPVDVAGVQCYQAFLTVNGQVQKVIDVTKGQTVGAISSAEIASAMIPGSPQFVEVEDLLVSGCWAKAQQVQASITIASSPATILAAATPALQALAPAIQALPAL